MDYKEVFFKPRVGINYNDGFIAGKMKTPLKILVLGAHHVCNIPCEYAEECEKSSRKFDHICPCYKHRDNQDYYCLSNSNVLEIDGFVEGNLYATYSSYSAFTRYLMHKRDYVSPAESEALWDKLAFYNFMQDFRRNGNTPEYESQPELYERYMPAFREVLEEIKPQLIIVWNQSTITALENSGIEGLVADKEDLGMQAITLTIFTYKYNNPSNIKALKSYLNAPYTIKKNLISLFNKDKGVSEKVNEANTKAQHRLRQYLNFLHSEGIIEDNTSLRFTPRAMKPTISNGVFTVNNYNNIHTGIVKAILDDIFSIANISITQTQFIEHSLFVTEFKEWSSALKAYKAADEGAGKLIAKENGENIGYGEFIGGLMGRMGGEESSYSTI